MGLNSYGRVEGNLRVNRCKSEGTGQGGMMESRFLEITSVGQEQAEEMGLPGQPCMWSLEVDTSEQCGAGDPECWRLLKG